MRRRAGLVVATAVALVITLSGCAAVAGDGDVSGDWAVLPKAKVPVPASGVCRSNTGSDKHVDWDLALFASDAVACTQKHASETYYVGTIADAKAVALSSPPEAGDEQYKPIYVNCMKRAEEFLGGDYHNARVSIVAVLPNDTQWRGEARFYRCEMLEISDDEEAFVERSASLKDGLRGSRPAAMQCANYTVDGDYLENFAFVACSKPHLAEYTGVFVPKDGTYPGDDKASDQGSDGCFAIGAKYLNMSSSALDASAGYQWIHDGMSKTYWNIGDRGQRCYIGPYPDKKTTGSVKGKSPSKW
jgi:hypothetical protein